MDDELVAIDRDEHNDFEQVACPVGSEDEPTIRILVEIVDDESVSDGVGDVVVVHAVSSSRPIDLHTPKAYYEMRGASQPTALRKVTRWS